MSSSESDGGSGDGGLREEFVRRVVQGMFGVTTLYGVSLFDNPVQFVATAVIDWFVNVALLMAGAVGADLNLAIGTTASALVETGAVLVSPFATIGRQVSLWLTGLEAALIEFTTAFGPFAPLVAYGVASVVAIGITLLAAWSGKVAWNQTVGRVIPTWTL